MLDRQTLAAMPEVVVLEPEFVPPTHFDGFAVERPLGRGGMGHVYLGRDVDLDRLVALKFVTAREGSATARERFRREARAIARLSHPNVVSIYRIGEVAEQPYIAYELVAGRSLDRIALPLPWPIALRIAVGIARGLDAVHRAGILHRDLKPANVVLSDAGDVKLIDFGLASLEGGEADAVVSTPSATAPTIENLLLTRPGMILGTPAYIAPEQWFGQPATARSDVYSFGITLYELLTGALPHARLPFDEVRRFVLLQDLPSLRSARPDVPESFAAAIDRCVRKDPAERFASGAEIRAVLETAERIFVQAGAASPAQALALDSDHVAVASSFVRVKTKGASFAQSVYRRLFASAPDVRALFPLDMTAQEAKLVHMIEVALESLSAPETLETMLGDLGRRHVHYGAKVEHFQALWTALLDALAEHEGPAWTDALARAWRSTLATLEEKMRRGMVLEQPTALSGQVNVNVLRLPPPIFDLRATPQAPLRSGWKAPRTQYARSGGAELAFQVFGEGAVDIVLALGWPSHVELNWGHRSLMTFLEELGRFARVVVYDRRGTGLSDRTRDVVTLDEHVADLGVVCAEAKCVRPVLFGISDGVPLALVASALEPERFAGLVLDGASPKRLRSEDFPHGSSRDQFDAFATELENGGAVDQLAPSMASDPSFGEWLALYMRMSASPTHARAMLASSVAMDLRALLPHVPLPTLVTHRTDDRLVPIAAARYLAKEMPRAQLFEECGADHLPYAGDPTSLCERIRSFVRKDLTPLATPAPLRILTTFRDADGTLGPLAREIAVPLGGLAVGGDGGVGAYLFARPGHAVLFLQRLYESSGASTPFECALDVVPTGTVTIAAAIASVSALARASVPVGRVPIGALAVALLSGSNVAIERSAAGPGLPAAGLATLSLSV